MKVAGAWFQNPDTQRVLHMLTDAGHQAYMVGGCIRNALMGLPVSDIDISTDARPEIVTDLAQKAGLKAIPTGIAHGTVTVMSGGQPHEITTFRKDIDTDGRHAVVAFSTSMLEDARRRDFTMNALYADAAGQVHDPLGGLTDIRARRVRFIGAPQDRIREDYLRILRFFRFTAWYGDPALGFEVDSLAAISANLGGLETLSKERIGSEMCKLLLAPDPAPALAVMEQIGVLHAILDGGDAKTMGPLVHLEQQAGLAPDLPRRLAALGGRNVQAALKLSKADECTRAAIQQAAMNISSPAEMGYRLGPKQGMDAFLLRLAYLETEYDPDQAAQVAFGAAQRCPVQAADLIDRLQGPALGAALKQMEKRWIDSGFTLTKPELLKE